MLRTLSFATAVLIGAAQPASSAGNDANAEVASARALLVGYLEDFANGSYAKVIRYVSDNSWATLKMWNPPIAESDSLSLLEAGCNGNGLQCLHVRTVEHCEQVGEGECRISVTFFDRNGTLFVRGPCCGSTIEEDPPDSVFTYTVQTSNGRTQLDLPPYVP